MSAWKALLLGLGLSLGFVTFGCNTTYNVTMAIGDDKAEAIELYKSVNLPTVKVMAETGTGSGVVFGNGEYVLTAAHVISHHDMVDDGTGEQTPGPNILEKATIFKNEGVIPFVTGTELVKIDYDLDLAILKLARVYPYGFAKFSPFDPYLYQKCWASGHPHGVDDATITEGRVQDLWDHGFVRYSSPTTFGNSGGPVFIRVDGRYVVSSIVQRVHVEGMGVATTHMGLGCLPDKVRAFVEGIGQ